MILREQLSQHFKIIENNSYYQLLPLNEINQDLSTREKRPIKELSYEVSDFNSIFRNYSTTSYIASTGNFFSLSTW